LIEVETFVRRQNIERYRRLLELITDASERQRIANLLAEEEQNKTPGDQSNAPARTVSD
jgi:hypothetical protein